MKFKNTEEVKTWLRGIRLTKKELEMKTAFFTDLEYSSRRMGKNGCKHEAYYRRRIEELHRHLQTLTADTERLLATLTPDERMILTARYIKGVMWDAMEFYVYYSRRQAIRIHDRAVKKLVGQEVACHGCI